jgi:RNA polymerase sigma-70 factor (ECF subfamily)
VRSEPETPPTEVYVDLRPLLFSEGLVQLLGVDVIAYSDSGGKASALLHPMHGRERVGRLMRGFGGWREELGATELRLVELNRQPGALFLDDDGRVVLAVSLDIADGLVQTIRAITNPEKLRHLDPGAGGAEPGGR